MKLPDHVEGIRKQIDTAFRNRLGRMGITPNELNPVDTIPSEFFADRKRIETIREVLIAETKNIIPEAYEKLIEEFTFTLFNRLAALKVMEAHTLHPEVVTRRSQHGDRSFSHKHWLEQNPDGRHEDMEGMIRFMEDQLKAMATEIPLFSTKHPYHLLPTAIELNAIINAFNQVESDPQIENDIWQSDDVLGWLYESYNNYKKAAHKESGDKTEYNKVSIQSQVYTPRWVVKFLVDNSLGKLYLEMYPDSEIKYKYKIANAPKTQTRTPKKLTEIKLIDPVTGSGNFLLYAFDLFYDLYTDQVENYGADYNDHKIAEQIITHNLHGVDLDDRAIQLAQLGLYIKAKRKRRTSRIEHFNVVSSDFYLPPYDEVQQIFEDNVDLDAKQKAIIHDIWIDLQQAYKFGSLIRLEERLSYQLHGLTQQFQGAQLSFFTNDTLSNYEQFRDNFFANLQKAVAQNTDKQGQTFLNTKTQDAISFLQLLTQKYDVAVANPPYTDSADLGIELKFFIDNNYRQPYKFNSNLYATFIKRCCELTNQDGFVGIIHPHTFMFIKTFEDVRKYLIEHTHIDLLVDYGLDRVNLFGTNILLDAAWYILSKKQKNEKSIYFNIKANQQEKHKQASLGQAYNDLLNKNENDRIYLISQSKLKIIEGWPFIYWISDGFREKFKENKVVDLFHPTQGVATTNNYRFLRFWWEIANINSSISINESQNRWYIYSKGGPYNKWYGNLWVVLDWNNNGDDLIKAGAVLRNSSFYFKPGITYSALGGTKISFRELPEGCIFDVGGSCIFPSERFENLNYAIAFLNSSLTKYIVECLNPTVNIQVGDIQRIPFIIPNIEIESKVSEISKFNILIKKRLCAFRIVEINFHKNPLTIYLDNSLKDRLRNYLHYENTQITLVLLNEAILNQLIQNVYELSDEDRQQVEAKIGLSVGQESIGSYELQKWKSKPIEDLGISSEVLEIIDRHIDELPIFEFDEERKKVIIDELITLYQNNNDFEEFCTRHQVNPINIWCWFNESKVLPQGRAAEIILEFLADAFRTILLEDVDGIISLVGLPGEPKLMDRLEQYCFHQGFTSAQFMQLEGLIGRPISEYIEYYFFKNFSDHLNLFMHLPKTPFIWHLSSGEHQGFEAYIIIYKWNRDSLYKLKSNYLVKRSESLLYRLQQFGDSTSAQAQTEKETIRLQLQEIDLFTLKIDELIAEGYDPKLDDGVGKNIAPLQEKHMLKAEVLKSSGQNSQLQKYLNADW